MRKGKMSAVFGAGIIMGLFMGWTVSGHSASGFNIPERVEVEVDSEFYKTLKEESEANVLGTRSGKSSESGALRRISRATQQTAKSSEEIIRQQKKMIRLLEAIAKNTR